MRTNSIDSIAIVGLGLIGASVLRAFRKSSISTGRSILFKGYDPAFGEEDITRIRELGLDRFETDMARLYDADLIILAAPVMTNIALLDEVKRRAPEHALVSDVSSTKLTIALRAAELGVNFVGMHPIAGRERQGYHASDEELLTEKAVVLCADEKTASRTDVRQLRELLESIRCRVVVMTPWEHDRIVAAISHLPQLLSVTLVTHCEQHIDMSGPGFSSLARLAGSPWEIWRDIVATNRENIASELRSFSRKLDALAADVESGNMDRIGERFEQANRLYANLNENNGS
ncbi:prephenate dehydrogenase [Prosthecochloris sp. GSB1]|uniref:prephenate dehydrogenase n=1 Tax=Prosthecochloris sp. GSB1 TaxID=281093 RepID=UPI000B8C8311|nr:prephenate dehydrogenase/arogenate dehydrogenase family protein [Prosthecochloris sp. GSB1]ASQ91424.1 prephenate dehydrogenase [Prosthecochloris sp. GSB1]